jgi:lysophospholipase L1-like esterase
MRALIVGDSHAAGAMGQRLEARLRGDGFETRRLAEVGRSADRWLAERGTELRQLLASWRPDVVFYVFGSNDIYRADRTAPTARTLLGLGSNPWWIGPPSYQSDSLTNRTALTTPLVASVFGTRFLDSRPLTRRDCVGRAPDCVHFTAAAGRAWADALYVLWHRRQVRTSPPSSPQMWLGPVLLIAGAVSLLLALRRRRELR